jgi:hypothetical protein
LDRPVDPEFTAEPSGLVGYAIIVLAGKDEKSDQLEAVGLRQVKQPVIGQQIAVKFDPGWLPVLVMLELLKVENADDLTH